MKAFHSRIITLAETMSNYYNIKFETRLEETAVDMIVWMGGPPPRRGNIMASSTRLSR